MIDITVTDQIQFVAFWLCFTRWTAILFQIPLFDNTSIPVMVKVFAILLITYAFFPFLENEIIKDIQYVGVDSIIILTLFNLLVGLILGMIVKSIMSVFFSAGSIITQQLGFSAVRYFDPSFTQNAGPFEILLQWSVIIMVLSSGALLPMFKGAMASFSTIHIYDMQKIFVSPDFFLMLFKNLFLSSILLASPLILSNLVMMSIMGVIARTVPQMNVLMISFVVNIGIGLVVLTLSSTELFQTAFNIYTKHLGSWFKFVT